MTQDDEYRILVSRFRKLMENSVESTNFPSDRNEDSLAIISGDRNTSLHFKSRRRERVIVDCAEIQNITEKHYIASGWTKAVYRGFIGSKEVAMKTVDIGGQDVSNCVKWGQTLAECYYRAAQKIIKEIVLLQELENENLVKVLGYCVPQEQYNGDDVTLVSLITELGETIDLIRLLPMSWEDRLRISYDLTKLIHFMSHSPHGSIVMNDFRHQQFVLVKGQLKLSDIDDIGIGEPQCNSLNDCAVHSTSVSLQFTAKIPCQKGRCVGLNEKKNIFNAGRHFIMFRLPHGAPDLLRPILTDVVIGFTNLTMNSDTLLANMEKAVNLYKSGAYLNRTSPVNTTYKEMKQYDLPGIHDYRCWASLSGTGCALSVFDRKEAEDMCDTDPECHGFVMTQETTWTGRKIVHFKNNVSIPVRNPVTNLYVRPP